MPVTVEIFQPAVVKQDKIEAAKAAFQALANEQGAEVEVINRDADERPTVRFVATPE